MDIISNNSNDRLLSRSAKENPAFSESTRVCKADRRAGRIDKEILDILEVAALTHDIGIKISEEKYNSSAGKYQEIEGPAVAQQMLERLAI